MSKKSVLEEAAKMVVGMVNYYSESSVSYEDIYAVLAPLIGDTKKDNAGYVAYAKQYREYVESQNTEK